MSFVVFNKSILSIQHFLSKGGGRGMLKFTLLYKLFHDDRKNLKIDTGRVFVRFKISWFRNQLRKVQ